MITLGYLSLKSGFRNFMGKCFDCLRKYAPLYIIKEKEMQYCKKCFAPESNPGITFDRDGFCTVCKHYETKPSVDWAKRMGDLKEIASWAKASSKGGYDCVIGVSGGKDSCWQALTARDMLGLNCLLVSNPADLPTEIGRHNIENLQNLGFDLIKYYGNPLVYKELVKRSLVEYGNPQKPSEYTIAAMPLRIAINFKIPLVIHGENSALEMGEPKEFTTDGEYGGSALGFANSNTVRGGNAKDWLSDQIGLHELLPYQYPTEDEIKESGVQAIYLGYYLKEFGSFSNAKFAISKGLRIRTESLYEIGRYDRYSALDSQINIINGMIKHVKFGYGTVTDHASFDIRLGRLTREEGIALIKELDGLCADYHIKAYCDYLGIPVGEFMAEVEKWRGDMWQEDGKGNWQLKNPIWEQESSSDNIDIKKVIRRLYEGMEIDHLLARDVAI